MGVASLRPPGDPRGLRRPQGPRKRVRGQSEGVSPSPDPACLRIAALCQVSSACRGVRRPACAAHRLDWRELCLTLGRSLASAQWGWESSVALSITPAGDPSPADQCPAALALGPPCPALPTRGPPTCACAGTGGSLQVREMDNPMASVLQRRAPPGGPGVLPTALSPHP